MDLIASGISGRVICLGIENQLGVNIGSFFFFFFTRNFTLEDHSRFRLKSFFQSFLKDFFKSLLLFV